MCAQLPSLDGNSRLGFLNLGVDAFTLLEHLLPTDEVGNTFDEDIDESGLTLTETVGVADVKLTTFSCRVDSSSTTGLEAEFAAEVLEVFAGGK